MGRLEWGLLLILSVLWGGSFFFSKVALAALPPFTVVLGRVSLAAVVLNLVVLGRGQRMPSSLRLWSLFLVMGGAQQSHPVQSHLLGPNPHREWASIDPQRDDAAVDGAVGAYPDQ